MTKLIENLKIIGRKIGLEKRIHFFGKRIQVIDVVGPLSMLYLLGFGVWGMGKLLGNILDGAVPEIHSLNVVGDTLPERFYYNSNGQRVYLEVDGMSVNEYIDRNAR